MTLTMKRRLLPISLPGPMKAHTIATITVAIITKFKAAVVVVVVIPLSIPSPSWSRADAGGTPLLATLNFATSSKNQWTLTCSLPRDVEKDKAVPIAANGLKDEQNFLVLS